MKALPLLLRLTMSPALLSKPKPALVASSRRVAPPAK
jgi:hypothetical protein